MAKGPGTSRSVGKVGVDVVPDTSKFREELKAKLERELAKIKVKVPVHADTTMARAEIEDFRRAMEARDINIDVDVDIPESKALAAELQKSMAGFNIPSFHVGMDIANIKQLRKEMEAISKSGGSLGVTAKDADHVEQSLKKLTKLGLGKVFNLSGVDKGLIFLDRMAGVVAKGAQGFFNWTQSAHKTKDALSGLGKVGREGLERITSRLPAALGGFIKLGKGIIQYGLNPLKTMILTGMKFTAIAGAVGVALAGTAQLGALLTQMLGVVIEAPAALATVAAVVGVILLGVDGIKKAFAGLPKAIAPLRKTISGIFEKTMGPGVQALGRGLNGLKSGFSSLAGSLGGFFTSFAQAFARPDNILATNIALKNMSGFFQRLRGAAKPLVNAFTTLVSVGTGGMGKFADTLVRLAEKFDAFIQRTAASGQLQEWIHNAVEGFKTFGRVVFGAGKFLLDIFKAIKPAIGSLQPLFSALGSVLTKSLAPILSDIVITLGPAFTEFINAIGAALDVARPGIQAFAKGFANFLRALAPAMPAIGKLVDVLGTQLGNVLTQLGPLIAQIITLFAGELAEVLPDLIPALIEVAKAFGDIFIALAPVIKPLAQIATVILKAFAQILEEIGPPLADFVVQLVQMLAPYIPPLVDAFLQLFKAIQPLIKPFLDLVMAVLKPLLPLLGPIADLLGLIATILTPLVKVIAVVVEGLTTIIGGLGHIIASVGKQGPGFLMTTFKQYMDSVQQMDTVTAIHFNNIINQFFGLQTAAQTAWSDLGAQSEEAAIRMSTGFQRELAKIQIALDELFGIKVPEKLRQMSGASDKAWQDLASGAASGTKKARGSVTQMGDSTKGFLDSLDTFSSGQHVTNSFADGILSAVWRATGAAAAVVSAVDAFFPHSPAKTGPFSGRGWTPFRGRALVEGFAEGIIATTPVAAAAAQKVMNALSSPFEAGFGNMSGFVDATTGSINEKINGLGVNASASIDSTVKAGGLESVGAQIENAISNWTVAVKVDQKAVGKMAKKYDTSERRRG